MTHWSEFELKSCTIFVCVCIKLLGAMGVAYEISAAFALQMQMPCV